MKDLIIFGNGNFPKLLKYYIDTDDSRSVACFTVNRQFMAEGDTHCGLPVIPFDELTSRFPPDEYDILVGVGYSKMNDNRRKTFAACKEAGYGIASYIHSTCSVHTDDIGEGNIMLERCLVYPFSKIGDGNLMFDTVNISHDSVIGSFNFFAGGTDLCGYVTIGDNCYFGKGCVLDNEFVAADYTLVGAGAYARGKTEPYEVIVPQRSVRLDGKRSTDFF